jgi:hypothetical protein
VRHPYQRDPHSGAGNCGALLSGKTCGRAEVHRLHPHQFTLAAFVDSAKCICTEPYWADVHCDQHKS